MDLEPSNPKAANCGLSFKTYHRLKKHKDERNHYIRKRKDKKVSVEVSNIKNCIEAYTRPLADAEIVNTETEEVEEVEVAPEENASVSRTVEDEDEEGVETFEEEMMPGTESEEEDEEEG